MKIPAQHNTTHPPGQHCSEPIGKTIEEYREEWAEIRGYKRGYADGLLCKEEKYSWYSLGSEAGR